VVTVSADQARRPNLQFTVRGVPAPQGSKEFKGFSKTGRAILTESSRKVRPWRQDVISAAVDAMETLSEWRVLSGAVHVVVEFYLPRPQGQPKGRRTLPITMPDLDKTVRSTLDALKIAGVYTDDARVTDLTTRKRYVVQDEALGHPWELPGSGAVITIFEVDPEDTWADSPLDLAIAAAFPVPQLPEDLTFWVTHVPVLDLDDVLGEAFVVGVELTDSRALSVVKRVLTLVDKREGMASEKLAAAPPALLIVENGLTRLASIPGRPLTALQEHVTWAARDGRDYGVSVVLADRVRSGVGAKAGVPVH